MLKLQLSNTALYGPAYFDEKTKRLIRYIPPDTIAILNHRDIDEMAATSLIKSQVKAVLNLAPSISGDYPCLGTKRLIESGIPVFDIKFGALFTEQFRQGDLLMISEEQLYSMHNGVSSRISPLFQYTETTVQHKIDVAKSKLNECLKTFTENTLYFAHKEMNEILKKVHVPSLYVNMQDRHVVIVTRGNGYIEDLKAIKAYIEDKKPVLIGVDGGADAILECGYCPDIIFGDMDSVSTAALLCGAEMVVHAYPNGYGPGVEVLRENRLAGHLFPCFGTSEDAAHLLAYESGASLIVTIGSHTNMLDFLEKGRKGMGSTLLVRLKIGEKLVDAKGVRLLYSQP